MSKFDLSKTFANFLDKHLLLKVLDFVENKQLYTTQDVLRAKYEVLSATKMVEVAQDLYPKVFDKEAPKEEFDSKKEAVFAEVGRFEQSLGKIIALIENEEEFKTITEAGRSALEVLKADYEANDSTTINLFRYAKLMYEAGQYPTASNFLKAFDRLNKDDEYRLLSAWGRLAAEIMNGILTDESEEKADVNSYEVALEIASELQKLLDQQIASSQSELLLQRAWLIHWSLFPFFKTADGPKLLLAFVFPNTKLVNAIQLTCPHVIRYLGAAMIISKQHKTHMGDMVRMLKQEKDAYADPITNFLTSLFVEFEFENVSKHLQDCLLMIENDYFLAAHKNAFLEQAQVLIFETLCKVHKNVSFDLLLKCLNMDGVKSEQQILSMAKKTPSINAKIDTSKEQLVVNVPKPSLHRMVLSRTRALFDEKPDRVSRKKKTGRDEDGDNEDGEAEAVVEDQSKWETIMNKLAKKTSGRV